MECVLSCLISTIERKPLCDPIALSLCALWKLIATFALIHRNMARLERRDMNNLEDLKKKGNEAQDLFCFFFFNKRISPGFFPKNFFPLLLTHPSFKAQFNAPSSVLQHSIPSDPLFFLVHGCGELLDSSDSALYRARYIFVARLVMIAVWHVLAPYTDKKPHSNLLSFKILRYSFQHLFPLYRLKPEKSEV